jgi:hypothetical protein
MSKRFEVGEAVKALVKRAVPNSKVIGMEPEEARPSTVDELGLVIVRSGDPGTPDIDLSPPTYWYEHTFPVELAARPDGARTARQVLDAMLVAIGREIEADRYLAGLCNYLDAEAPTDGETQTPGAAAISWADCTIIATYSTTSPLG